MKMEDVGPLEKEHSLSVVLPGGLEKNTTVHGSKPVMDLLVTLCARYHLNPSDYTVEVLSPNKNNISFKPNSPIGSLEAEKIVLKPRAGEEKIRAPYMPEATVRLLINYNKSHKAVVRVNPRLPLEKLLPLVCDKCEFQVENTVLLRDSGSKEPLDLSRTLNEHGLREVYARDTAAKERSRRQPHTAADLTKKANKPKDGRGLFSLFRKHRKHSDASHTVSAPSSPGLQSRSASISSQNDVASCTTLPKKRCAPPPPLYTSTSAPTHLSTCTLQEPQRSGDGTLRSTKRRAPPPPTPPAENHDVGAAKDSVKSLEELKESEETAPVNHPSSSSSASSSSPLVPPPPPSSPSSPSAPSAPPPLHKPPDSDRPGIKGLADARTALAKVLTSSLSTGMLAKRLKNSSAFSKVHNNIYAHDAPTSENDIEIKPVLNDADLRKEFEDPAERKGLTTFKVVPSRRESDAEPSQEVPAKEEEKENTEEEVEEEVILGTVQSLNVLVKEEKENAEEVEEEEEVISGTVQSLNVPAKEEKGNTEEEVEVIPETVQSLNVPLKEEEKENTEEEVEEVVVISGTVQSLNVSAKEEEKENAEVVVVEEVIPGTDQSLNVEVSPDQSECSSQVACPDETESTSCSVPLDRRSSDLEEVEDDVEAAKQNGEMAVNNDEEEEDESEQSQETDKRDLYLGEEEKEEEEEGPGKTNPRDDDQIKQNTQDEDQFPPPPPPVYFSEDQNETKANTSGTFTNGHEESNTEPPQRQTGSEGSEDTAAPSAPSMFAQAVAAAVQRSKLHQDT